MATTSLSLGEHWLVFIKNEISSGRYVTASGAVRDVHIRDLDNIIGIPHKDMDIISYFGTD